MHAKQKWASSNVHIQFMETPHLSPFLMLRLDYLIPPPQCAYLLGAEKNLGFAFHQKQTGLYSKCGVVLLFPNGGSIMDCRDEGGRIVLMCVHAQSC